MLELTWENKLSAEGYKLIGGVDEAGRGPLAGPVVAACVVFNFDKERKFSFPTQELISAVNDSKKLTAKVRQELFGMIKKQAAAVSVVAINHKTIDKINILQATFLAMRRAIEKIEPKPEFILVDGKFVIPAVGNENFRSIPQSAVVDGDAQVFSIAAASIMAKVTRDWLMAEFDKKYPGYGFAQHKGYGTKQHLELLKALGPSPIHRLSFKPLSRF